MINDNTIPITIATTIHDNDNGERRAVAPAPTGGALASLTALADGAQQRRHRVRRRPFGLPMLQFKAREATAPGCSGRSGPSSKTAAAGPSTR